MILRPIDENLYKEIIISHNSTESQTLLENPELISVADINSAHSGYYSKNELNQYVPNVEKELIELKSIKLEEVANKFENELMHGVMPSSLGFTVDNRRCADKNDKDNVIGLIDLGYESIQFKDSDGEFHVLSAADLLILKSEMTQDGLMKYQTKWNLENSIDSCTTISELDSISTQ